MAKKPIILSGMKHRGKNCIRLGFEYDKELIRVAKQLPGIRWSQTNKCWYTQNLPGKVQEIIKTFKGKAWVDASWLYNGHQPHYKQQSDKSPLQDNNIRKRDYKIVKEVPQAYITKLKIRRYSENTIRTYHTLFRDFINYFAETDPALITEEQIREYMDYLVNKRKVSYSTQNQAINAIKFFYEKVLSQQKNKYWIDRPRKRRRLPEVISEEDVIHMLKSTKNLKHACIIGLLYSAGLRRGEVINLKKGDLDLERKIIYVKAGKGRKDRTTILSDRLANGLIKYIKEYSPKYWFFESPTKQQYSGTSILQVVKQAAKKAGIAKTVTPHTLRHSFATHLMERGTDTRYLKDLLGHNSIKSTEIYTHVSKQSLHKIKSPLDQILDDKELKNKHLKQ